MSDLPERQERQLPDGLTCAQCVSFQRCKALIGPEHINDKQTQCDWDPSRFGLSRAWAMGRVTELQTSLTAAVAAKEAAEAELAEVRKVFEDAPEITCSPAEQQILELHRDVRLAKEEAERLRLLVVERDKRYVETLAERDALKADASQTREKALDEAALICRRYAADQRRNRLCSDGAWECERQIRAIKGDAR